MKNVHPSHKIFLKMKKETELSQRDKQKLANVKKMIECSGEYRKELINSVIKNLATQRATDDDEQKIALLLGKKSYITPECQRNYRLLCQTVTSNTVIDRRLIGKAKAFMKNIS